MSVFSHVTLITVQNDLHYSVCTILRISKRIYCLSDNFIISSYVVSGLHESLQELFPCLWFLPVDDVVRVPHKMLSRGVRSGDFAVQACGPK
jgi:hypothetical protein